MSDGYIFYTLCRNNQNVDWCTYACIDARDNGNTWYYEHEMVEACDIAESDDLWSNCSNEVDTDACAAICDSDSTNFTSDQKDLACTWKDATVPEDYFYYNCIQARDLDWCAWSCQDARNGNTWFAPEEQSFACNPSWTRKSMPSVKALRAKKDKGAPAKRQAGKARKQSGAYTWGNCKMDQDAYACQALCDSPSSLTQSQADLACVWADAAYMSLADIYYY